MSISTTSGTSVGAERDGVEAVLGDSDHLELRVAGEQGFDRLREQRMVVRDQHPHRPHVGTTRRRPRPVTRGGRRRPRPGRPFRRERCTSAASHRQSPVQRTNRQPAAAVARSVRRAPSASRGEHVRVQRTPAAVTRPRPVSRIASRRRGRKIAPTSRFWPTVTRQEGSRSAAHGPVQPPNAYPAVGLGRELHRRAAVPLDRAGRTGTPARRARSRSSRPRSRRSVSENCAAACRSQPESWMSNQGPGCA